MKINESGLEPNFEIVDTNNNDGVINLKCGNKYIGYDDSIKCGNKYMNVKLYDNIGDKIINFSMSNLEPWI